MIKRRSLLVALGSAATAWPLGVFGQAIEKPRRVAVLISAGEKDPEGQSRIESLRQGLRDLGWIEGRNIQLDVRFAGGKTELFHEYTAAFIANAPDLIVVNSTAALGVVYEATKTIPVVFMAAFDPVGLGYIKSLAHPGGNITGFTFWDVGLMSKWLQLLKEAAPSIDHATVIHNPSNTTFYPALMKSVERLPGLPNVALTLAPVRSIAEIERVFDETARLPGGSVIVPSDPFNLDLRYDIAAAALHRHLPLISIYRPYATAGAFMSYGPDINEIYRQSATYVDRILKGANPGDLPAQAPTKYEFVINTVIAGQLGLAIPSTLLARTDEVIE